MTDKKGTTNEAAPLHEIDGIQELDNHMPRWWLWKFYLTIVFSAIYFFYYQIGQGPTQEAEYQAKMNAHRVVVAAANAQKGQLSEADFEKLSQSSERVAQGKQVYAERCVSCHGSKGEGGIGPNLTDNAFLHGKKFVEMAKVVEEGVSDKGMPPWGALLKTEEIQAVVVFAHSLQGTNAPGGKAPQGTN